MTTLQPLVSVILPTYKRSALLSRAIRSVLGQTYRNLELIVVDDASPDDTPEVVRQFSESRLRYIRLEQNSRAAAARNVGLRAARGPLIAFNDDDDIWLVSKLERQVRHLLNAPADVGLSICGHICEFPTHSTYVGGRAHLKDLVFDGISDGAPLIATPGWLLKREYLDEVGGFDEGMRCWDDWELACRLSRKCRIAHLDEPLFVQDQKRQSGEGGMTDSLKDFANDYRILFERHAHEWPAAQRQSRHMFALGNNLAMFGEYVEGRAWLKRAIRANPLNYKAWIAWVLSYLPQRQLKSVTLWVRRFKTRLRNGKVSS